jgi:L-seryl-tRNA(Ser) seleniumtransferase
VDTLRQRAKALVDAIAKTAPTATLNIDASHAYLGSGSLPTESIPSVMVSVSVPGLSAADLARRLRMDQACVFSRIEDDLVRLDVRTLTNDQVPAVAAAFERIAQSQPS